MRGMKIAAVLSMLLATSAFGAVSLVVAPSPAVPDAAGNLTLTFTLDNPDGASVWGYGLKAIAPAGAVRIQSRANLNSVITDPTNTDANVNAKALEAVPDLGFSAALGSDVKNLTIPLQSLALTVQPGVTLPITITFQSVIADVDFNETALADVAVDIVPEPASMMLLAAGAAFFARRRRMA